MGNDLVTELMPTYAFLCFFTSYNGSKTKYYVKVKQHVTFIFRFWEKGLDFYPHFVPNGTLTFLCNEESQFFLSCLKKYSIFATKFLRKYIMKTSKQ